MADAAAPDAAAAPPAPPGNEAKAPEETEVGANGATQKKRANKKKKKKKKAANNGDAAAEAAPKAAAATAVVAPAAGSAPGAGAAGDKLTQSGLIARLQQQQRSELERRLAAAQSREHRFWSTQPVPQFTAGNGGPAGEAAAEETAAESPGPAEPKPVVSEPIEVKTVADIDPSPLALPAAYEWSIVDITDDDQLGETYRLLTENYVEDDDNMFRFDYSRDFLRWALLPPGWNAQFHLGVRRRSSNALMAFITGVPAHMDVHGEKVTTVEINFLCVHKRLRSKRLAPVLIKEITRRVNLAGIFQAVYTAGVVLPRPVTSCRYWHRSLNPKKLIEVGFSRLGPRMTMSRTLKLHRLPADPVHPWAPMEAADVPVVTRLLAEYLTRFKLHPDLNEDEVTHWLLPREGVIDAFVLRNGSGTVTDFLSFYHLPSSIINHPQHDKLSAVYSYYNVAGTLSLFELMKDALILALRCGVDVFNALDLMQNTEFLKDLKFGIGDGDLQYYLYNWRCTEMAPHDIGLVLL